MNQILVTEKLYITPELKRKKKIYKFYFILSVFVVCILTSFYIYAEYDRNKSAEASQQLLDRHESNISREQQKIQQLQKMMYLLVVLKWNKRRNHNKKSNKINKNNNQV